MKLLQKEDLSALLQGGSIPPKPHIEKGIYTALTSTACSRNQELVNIPLTLCTYTSLSFLQSHFGIPSSMLENGVLLHQQSWALQPEEPQVSFRPIIAHYKQSILLALEPAHSEWQVLLLQIARELVRTSSHQPA